MTDFNGTESAKWAVESGKIAEEVQLGADKALSEAAARGYAVPPGDTLGAILASVQGAKGKLVEANGKIYEERRGVLFQQEEFEMKRIVQVAKLSMEMYRAELLNAIEIEQAQNNALRDQGTADVIKMTAEIESRQAAIIRGRAAAEQAVIGYKVLLAVAERNTLEYEVNLAQAQLATATKRLEVIESIYQVLAAEELVLAAERARAAALENVLAAKEELAAVKTGMIGLYAEKAGAKEQLAAAITAEVPVKAAIENLGYDRIGLKTYEANVEHEVRQAELILETARAQSARASIAVQVARAASQTAIQLAANAAENEIMSSRTTAGMTQISTRMADRLGHAAIESDAQVAIADHAAANLNAEISSIVANITARALSDARKAAASSDKRIRSDTTHLISRKIVEGSF